MCLLGAPLALLAFDAVIRRNATCRPEDRPNLREEWFQGVIRCTRAEQACDHTHSDSACPDQCREGIRGCSKEASEAALTAAADLEGDLRKAHRVVSEQLDGASQARTDDVPRHPDRSLESPSKRERVHSQLGPHVIPFELGVEMVINVSDGVARRVQRKSPVADPVVVAAIEREASTHARMKPFSSSMRRFEASSLSFAQSSR